MKGIDTLRPCAARPCSSWRHSLSATGCSGGGDGPSADPTVPTAASTTSTSAVPDVSTISAVIDAPYLNRVLAALDEVDGMATRVIVANKDLVPEAAEILNSIYADEEFTEQADVWLNTLDQDPDLRSIKASPGRRTTQVERIISASASCAWMAVSRDYSGTATQPKGPHTEYVALRPLDESNDPKNRNPTAWMIAGEGYDEDGSEPANQCARS